MKGIVNRILGVLLLTVPRLLSCETIAYSPSIPGMPLIFHFNTALLEPFPYSAVTWTQLQNALLIRSSYTQHLDNLPNRCCCDGWNVWTDVMGQWLQQSQSHFGYDNVTGGLTLGADTCFNDFLVGAAASYTYSDLQWRHSGGHTQINSYYGGLYGSWSRGCFYMNASALGAYSDYHITRHWHFRSLDRHPNARHSSGEALAGLEAGYKIYELFIPFASVDYVYLSQPAYTEGGAFSYNLHVQSRNDQLVQSEVGLRIQRRCLNVSLSYVNQTPLSASVYRVNFVQHNRPFNVKGWKFERNLGAIGVNLNLLKYFTLHYDGQFGKNYWTQTGSVSCNLSF